MRYIVCEKPGKFLLKEKTIPLLKENEALLKIYKVGICGTDLHAYTWNQPFFTYPRILGNELATKVLEIGENPKDLLKEFLDLVLYKKNFSKERLFWLGQV